MPLGVVCEFGNVLSWPAEVGLSSIDEACMSYLSLLTELFTLTGPSRPCGSRTYDLSPRTSVTSGGWWGRRGASGACPSSTSPWREVSQERSICVRREEGDKIQGERRGSWMEENRGGQAVLVGRDILNAGERTGEGVAMEISHLCKLCYGEGLKREDGVEEGGKTWVVVCLRWIVLKALRFYHHRVCHWGS